MLAVALGRAAAEAGYRTSYTTAAELAARCHRAAIEGRWATTMRFYAGPRLLIIEEVGYLPLPAEAAAALFQVIAQRYHVVGPDLRRPDGRCGDAQSAAPSLRRVCHQRRQLPDAGPPGTGRASPSDNLIWPHRAPRGAI